MTRRWQAPLIAVLGAGGVEVEPGVPLVESPLDASFDMSTQGDMTILFNGLGLLQEDADEHGDDGPDHASENDASLERLHQSRSI